MKIIYAFLSRTLIAYLISICYRSYHKKKKDFSISERNMKKNIAVLHTSDFHPLSLLAHILCVYLCQRETKNKNLIVLMKMLCITVVVIYLLVIFHVFHSHVSQ